MLQQLVYRVLFHFPLSFLKHETSPNVLLMNDSTVLQQESVDSDDESESEDSMACMAQEVSFDSMLCDHEFSGILANSQQESAGSPPPWVITLLVGDQEFFKGSIPLTLMPA